MKKKSLLALTITDAALLFVAIFANLLTVYTKVAGGTFDIFNYVIVGAQIVVAILAIYYILTECKKGQGTKYFKWFMGIFAIEQLVTMFFSLEYIKESLATTDIINTLLIAVSFAALAILTFGKDLGQCLSFTFGGAVTVAAIARAVIAFCIGELETFEIVSYITLILLGLTVIVMVYAKYQDKKERGSK